MTNNQITFNDLPQVVAELRDEVSGMKALLLNPHSRHVAVAEWSNDLTKSNSLLFSALLPPSWTSTFA